MHRAANVRAARDEGAVRHVSITREDHRPTSGWPALVSEARKYMGTNPTAKTRLWCATFMNMVLAKTGYSGTNSDAAKSFAQYGRRISEPKVGAIAVLTRGKNGGHVGVVSGVDANGNPIIISGNHNKRVGESVYPRGRVIAYVMPTENRTGNTQLASNTNRPSQDDGLDSPIAELIAAIEAEQSSSSRRPAPPQKNAQAASRPNAEPSRARREVELEPAIAELLGIKQRGQARRAARRSPSHKSNGRYSRSRPAARAARRAGFIRPRRIGRRSRQPASAAGALRQRVAHQRVADGDVAGGNDFGIDAAIGVAEVCCNVFGIFRSRAPVVGSTLVAAQRTMRLTTLSRALPIASSAPSRSNSCQAGQPLT